MMLQWNIWNNGSLDAVGYKCDTAYLSEDTEWDITDHQLGEPICSTIFIPPMEASSMQQRSLSVHASRLTPFIAQDNYSCIVRTRTSIRDPNLANNIGVSVTPVRVNAPTLYLGVSANVSISSSNPLVYKIDNVPGENTLIVKLTASLDSGFHDIFLQHGTPPTGSKYDAFSQYSLSHNQTAVVQSTKPGVYYIRIESFGRNIEAYQIQIMVELAAFEIINISPTFAAPLGNVTLHISGTLISDDVQASLIYNTTSESPTISSSAVYWFSSVEVYATFDIRNLSTGFYTLQLINPKTNEVAELSNRFRITSGIPGRVSTRIDAPRNLLRGESTLITMFVQNSGNNDISTPIMFIRSSRNVQLSIVDRNSETEDAYRPELIFLPVPLQGPAGIIPPGVTTKVLFRLLPNSFRSSFTDTLSTSYLEESQMDIAHSYVEKKGDLKPSNIPDESWDIVWDNFMNSVGRTWRTLTQRLSDIDNELSLGHKRVESVDALVSFQLRIAQGSVGPLGKAIAIQCFSYFNR